MGNNLAIILTNFIFLFQLGNYALHYAALTGNTDVTSVLLLYDVDVNATNIISIGYFKNSSESELKLYLAKSPEGLPKEHSESEMIQLMLGGIEVRVLVRRTIHQIHLSVMRYPPTDFRIPRFHRKRAPHSW
jgi:hypothetical protein